MQAVLIALSFHQKIEMINMRITLITCLLTVLSLSPECFGQTLNAKVASFLAAKVGTRVGGGECAHAASEALRASGAEFINTDLGPDSPAAGDYVWGTQVKTISIVNGKWNDSSPSTKLMAGDIIQYRNTKFVYPTSTMTAAQHTSIVATVNTAGSATFVYEQNFNSIRSVRKNAIDLSKLTTGYLKIYRPKTRITRTGQTKFSLTNNVAAAQTVSLRVGTTTLGTFSMTNANTVASYQTRWVTLTGTTTPITIRLPNGASITATNAAGYEIYTTSTGAPGIRKLPL